MLNQVHKLYDRKALVLTHVRAPSLPVCMYMCTQWGVRLPVATGSPTKAANAGHAHVKAFYLGKAGALSARVCVLEVGGAMRGVLRRAAQSELCDTIA